MTDNRWRLALTGALELVASALQVELPDARAIVVYASMLRDVPADALQSLAQRVLRTWPPAGVARVAFPPPAVFVRASMPEPSDDGMAARVWEQVRTHGSVCALTHPTRQARMPAVVDGETVYVSRALPCRCADAERWDARLIREHFGAAAEAGYLAAGGSGVLYSAEDDDPWPRKRFVEAFLAAARSEPTALLPGAPDVARIGAGEARLLVDKIKGRRP